MLTRERCFEVRATLLLRAMTTSRTTLKKITEREQNKKLRLDRSVEPAIETEEALRERLLGRGVMRGDFNENDDVRFLLLFSSFEYCEDDIHAQLPDQKQLQGKLENWELLNAKVLRSPKIRCELTREEMSAVARSEKDAARESFVED